MQDLVEKVENVQEDTSPEIYKDYKQLKFDIGEQREENQNLRNTLEKVARETADQGERVAAFQERILVMEESVGMMEYNEKYKASVEEDDLYQDSKVFGSKDMVQVTIGTIPLDKDEVVRKSYGQLNPASTTSSLERIVTVADQPTKAETQPDENELSPIRSPERVATEDIKV